MKTTIHFIEKKNDDFIFSIYADAVDNFYIGQKLYLNVEKLYPSKYEKIKAKNGVAVANMVDYHLKDLQKKIPIPTRFKIIDEDTTLEKNGNVDDSYHLKIEYYIKRSPKFYWKWWYIKSKIKKIFKLKSK
jgi:hypothetical protein